MKVFVAVVDAGSFATAAERLDICRFSGATAAR
jgi:DNA-binding transcriptional LysR family regulator